MVLSSHILSEVQAVCDIIMIIFKGRLVASDTAENLIRLFAGTTTLKLEARMPVQEARQVAESVPGVQVGKVEARDATGEGDEKWAILRKEVNDYFKGILGYLFTAFILIFAGIYTMAYNLSGYYANFEYVLDSISFIYLIVVPILSMRTVAEEKRQKTDRLLYSLPLSLTSVIVGKYLAMLVVLLVPVAIKALYPVVFSRFGTVSFATDYTA